MYRLGILTTHPIQYQVPWFRALAVCPEVELTVHFCQIPDAMRQGDGFGVAFEWDLPLLEGYRYRVLRNVAKEPRVTSFWGCDTPEIDDVVRRGEFDALLVNGWVAKSCLQALRACRRYGVPCLVRGESNALRPRAWWKRALHRQLLRQYAGFLVIGQSNADFYAANGVPRERLFPGHYCVDNDWFAGRAAALASERPRLRKEWGIPAEVPTFLFCGKLIGKKRPLELLRAFAEAARQQAMHLLIAGEGALRGECERFAAAERLPVTFAGFLNQSRIPEAYVAADCLVLPSDDGETWGLVVNEAMACGRPALVSDRVGCGPDLIVAGRTGKVFPYGDSGALSRLLVRLAEAPGELRAMGEAAARHVADYSVAALTQGTLAALRFVCDRNSAEAVRTKGATGA
jgi:glycosyltransferase involved in cell wall biosynthesis